MENKNIQLCKQRLLDSKMNRFFVANWEQLALSENFDLSNYNDLIFVFAHNIETQYGYAKKKSSASFLEAIEATIYKRLTDCENRGRLDILATLGVESFMDTIGIATHIEQIAAVTGVAVPMIELFASLVIIGILKIGAEAWCQYYESKRASKEDD